MPVTSQALKQDLDQLTNAQLQQVADFIAFLKFQDKRRRIILDPSQLASLATDFAEEDRIFAEAGMDDYPARLPGDACSGRASMTEELKRGEVWLANLNPAQGSEQAGIRPIIIFQNDIVSQFSTTTITIPLTTNQLFK